MFFLGIIYANYGILPILEQNYPFGTFVPFRSSSWNDFTCHFGTRLLTSKSFLCHYIGRSFEKVKLERLRLKMRRVIKMNPLRDESLKECVSLLREYVEESKAQDHKKGTAVLTINQLQKIIAGTDSETDVIVLSCNGKPILGMS
jgi:hypothetical protein